ncbi:MAG: hypothetical protein H0W50_05360 [Parachlamydiaceae bacterium]|nr:hypothetical protein [Parachlamydiaceae bacterium]
MPAIESTSSVRNLNLLDNELAKIQGLQEKELARGDKADSKKLYAYACKINVLFHGNDAAAQRKIQFEVMHDSDENNVKLVKKLDNKQAQFMQKLSAVVTLATPFITMGCMVTGFDVSQLSTALDAFGKGLSATSNVAAATDEAGKKQLEYAGSRFSSEIQDKQSTNQSSKGAESSSLRQIQEAMQADSTAFNAMVAGLR